MEEALRALLRADAGVAALVTGAAINWGAHPQGAALPGIVLHLISDGEALTMKGPDGLRVSRVQVDCWADTAQGCRVVGDAVVAALHGHRAGRFRLVEHTSTRDGREGGTNEATRPFRRSLDFTVNWR